MVVGESNGSLLYFENTGNSTSPAFVELTGAANPLSASASVTGAAPISLTWTVTETSMPSSVRITEARSTAREHGDFQQPRFCRGDRRRKPILEHRCRQQSVPGGFGRRRRPRCDCRRGMGGRLWYFENTGNSTSPTFFEPTGASNPFSGIDVGSSSSPELVDMDGDSDLDAVVGAQSGNLLYFENTGDSRSPRFVEGTGAGNPFDGIDVGFSSSPELVGSGRRRRPRCRCRSGGREPAVF